MEREKLNELSSKILHSSIHLHREMGPVLLELVYELCLKEELSQRGLK